MFYCHECHQVYNTDVCPECGAHLKEAQKDDDCFLVEKKTIWADMLKELLENYHIPYYCEEAMGAGVSLKVGPMLESYQFYVPYSHYQQAMECVKTFFKDESI